MLSHCYVSLISVFYLSQSILTFGENINALFHALHISAQIPFLDIFLPLGISFYTLSAISYVTDVAREYAKQKRIIFAFSCFWFFSWLLQRDQFLVMDSLEKS